MRQKIDDIVSTFGLMIMGAFWFAMFYAIFTNDSGVFWAGLALFGANVPLAAYLFLRKVLRLPLPGENELSKKEYDYGVLGELGYSKVFIKGTVVGIITTMLYVWPFCLLLLLTANTTHSTYWIVGGGLVWAVLVKLTVKPMIRFVFSRCRWNDPDEHNDNNKTKGV